MTRGEKVGPAERDPTAQEEVSLLGFLKFLVYLLLFTALAGKFFTGSFTWEYRSKWTQLKTYWPVSPSHLFSSTDRLISIAKSTSSIRTPIGRSRRDCSWKAYLSGGELNTPLYFPRFVYMRLNC
jgi:hypothetical protein